MLWRLGIYRIYRLRRLALVASLPPVLVVLGVGALKGPAALALLPLALGAPIAHLIRYPTAWMETVVVSLITSIVVALAGTIGADVNLVGLVLRIVALALMAFVLFLGLSSVLPGWLIAGEPRPHVAQTRKWSRLPPGELKAAITLYPGRQDERVTCSAPDEDGAFAVTVHQQVAGICDDMPEAFDIEMFAQVLTSTQSEHEVMCVEAEDTDEAIEEAFAEAGEEMDDELREALAAMREEAENTPPAVAVSRHTFHAARRGGTVVEVAETSTVMSRGMAFGFWVQDYYADHLTDEIDRAEGRPARSNRSSPQAQMIVDLARLFVRNRTPEAPAE